VRDAGTYLRATGLNSHGHFFTRLQDHFNHSAQPDEGWHRLLNFVTTVSPRYRGEILPPRRWRGYRRVHQNKLGGVYGVDRCLESGD
jgi:hypothetical protein